MPEHLPPSIGLPGGVAGAHRAGDALAPTPKSCRGNPREGGGRQHVLSSRWEQGSRRDRAVGWVVLPSMPSSAVMPTCGTGCLSTARHGCVCAVGDTWKQPGNGVQTGRLGDSASSGLSPLEAGLRKWQERVRTLETFCSPLNEHICASRKKKQNAFWKLSCGPDVTLVNVLRILVCAAACALRLWQ